MNVRSLGCLLLWFCSSLFAVPALASVLPFVAPPVSQPPLTTTGGLGVRGSVGVTAPSGNVIRYNFVSRTPQSALKARLAVGMKGVRNGNPYAVALIAGSAAVAYYFESNKYYFNESQYALYSESIEQPVSGTLWQGTGGYSDVEEMTLSLAGDTILGNYCFNLVGFTTPCDMTANWRISDRSSNAECLSSHTIGCYVRIELRRNSEASFNGQNVYLREFNQCPNGSYDPDVGGCVVSRPEAPLSDAELESSFGKLSPAQQDELLKDLIDYYPNDQFAYDYGIEPEFEPAPFPMEPWTETSVLPNGKTQVKTYTPDLMVKPYVRPDNKIGFDFTGKINESVFEDGLPVTDTDIPVDTSVPTAPASSNYSCDNFQFICDFFDWVRDVPDNPDEDYDSVWLDDDFQKADYDLSLGAGSCPPPKFVYIQFLNKSLEFRFDFICDMALAARPLFIAFCYLMSAFAYVRYL